METNKTFKVLLTGILASLSFSANAELTKAVIVAPHCLIEKFGAEYQTFSSLKNMALIEINESDIDKLNAVKHAQKGMCGGFMNVTHAWQRFTLRSQHKAAIFLSHYTMPAPSTVSPLAKEIYSIKYQTETMQILSGMNPQRMWNNLGVLSAFHDRYFNSDNGLKAANWIKDQVKIMAGDRPDISVYFIPTGRYKQPSVVAKLGSSTESGIVIGGHMDTTSGLKPGADDDGTGSVSVLEAAETLISSGMHFKKPIYFIWYAAEEVGLVGSQYVVEEFVNKNIPVSAVMQMDMTGYPDKANPNAMWLMDDYVNPSLTAYLEVLINTYIGIDKPVKHDSCGYACSDHATWTQYGFKSAVPFEASMRTYNPYVHSSQDTMEKLNLTHMTDYTKLALAFAVELAEPVT